jgi:mRNA interferase MazF
VQVKAQFLREGVFDVQNMITIPHAKLIRKLGSLTAEQMAEVEKVLVLWLGLEDENAEEDE